MLDFLHDSEFQKYSRTLLLILSLGFIGLNLKPDHAPSSQIDIPRQTYNGITTNNFTEIKEKSSSQEKEINKIIKKYYPELQKRKYTSLYKNDNLTMLSFTDAKLQKDNIAFFYQMLQSLPAHESRVYYRGKSIPIHIAPRDASKRIFFIVPDSYPDAILPWMGSDTDDIARTYVMPYKPPNNITVSYVNDLPNEANKLEESIVTELCQSLINVSVDPKDIKEFSPEEQEVIKTLAQEITAYNFTKIYLTQSELCSLDDLKELLYIDRLLEEMQISHNGLLLTSKDQFNPSFKVSKEIFNRLACSQKRLITRPIYLP
jgi:hypothetical protein